MRPVRIAVAVVLIAAAAVTGTLVARFTGHRSATPDSGVAAPTTVAGNPVPPTTVVGDPGGQHHPGPGPQPPTPILPLGRVEGLEAVQAVGTQIAVAVGKGTILTTHDGGRTWVRAWRGPQDLHAVDFVSASTGWAVGDGLLLGTVDGGQHWRRLGQPSVRPLGSVHFSSASEGWGVAGRNLPGDLPATVLVHTGDGGRTWSALPAPARPQSVCFTSPGDGWLASDRSVWRSVDGGRTWSVRPSFTLPVGAGEPPFFADLQCARPGAAWVRFDSGDHYAGHGPYALYSTGDGGAHWRGVLSTLGAVMREPLPGGPGSYPGPFSVIDPRRAFLLSPTPAADTTGAVLISQGGGRLQFLPEIPRARLSSEPEAMSVSFGSATMGWIAGSAGSAFAPRGVILATVDGGRTWRSQLPA
jgi:photosystem II stability/assembly factor-like uncharacterized protein